LLQDQGVIDRLLPTTGLEEPIAWQGSLDVAVNLHGCGPQSHHLLQALEPQRLVAYTCADAGFDAGPSWCAQEHEVERWRRLVRGIGGPCTAEDLRIAFTRSLPTDVVLVHPGAAAGARRWPVDRWQAVVREIARQGRRVAITGLPHEAVLCEQVASGQPGVENWCGRFDLLALARRVGEAAIVLSADTGMAHLATACGTPSVLLFGPTPPDLWGPVIDPGRHAVIWHPSPEDPPGDPHGSDLDVRLARVTVSEVLEAVERLAASPDALSKASSG
jgi:ADP-heptose:LPS heptosyltransferase